MKKILAGCITAIFLAGILSTGAFAMDTRGIIKSEVKCKTMLWKQAYNFSDNKDISIDLDGDKKQDMVVLGLDSPNGSALTVKLVKKSSGYNLFQGPNCLKYDYLYDDSGEIKEGYYLQVSFVDFDGDKKPEMVLAGGDGLVQLGVTVFKYVGGKNNYFEAIGQFEGQSEVIITKKKTILLPIGSQGLFSEYKYSKGKFVEINQ